jgi:hemerythrin superfamily protein
MAADAVSAIMQDHRMLERLFEECRTNRSQRPALVAEIRARLKAHRIAEEERVYPAFAAAAPSESDEVHHGVAEHREAEELLAEAAHVAATEPDSAAFDAAFGRFVAVVAHHVEEEEGELLPTLEDAVDRDELERLGVAFDERRREVLAEAGFDAPAEADLVRLRD